MFTLEILKIIEFGFYIRKCAFVQCNCTTGFYIHVVLVFINDSGLKQYLEIYSKTL